jgi:hypothetical protein
LFARLSDGRKLVSLPIFMSQTAQMEQEPFADERALSTVQNMHRGAKADPELVWHATQSYKRQCSALRSKILNFACFLGLALTFHHFWPSSVFSAHESQRLLAIADEMCPQVSAIVPSSHAPLIDTLDEVYGTKEFKLKAYESLGGAVRIPWVFLSRR